jgi:benzoylformate decarboxylase
VQQAVRKVLDKADLLFAVGAELFRMAAYAPLSPMPPALPLIQLNVDPWQLGKNYPANPALWGDPKATLAEMVVELRTRLDTTQHQRARQRRQLFGQLRAEALAALDQQCRRKEAGQPLCPNFAMRTLLEHAPDDAVIVDESNTTGINLRTFMYRRQLDYFAIKGGALGWGLPASIGVGLARPHQPVLALLGDGGAMYTIQGLWSAAHYRVKVVFVICNNTQYRIVKHRLHQSGGIASQVKNYPGVELQDPAIDFSSLARSMGLWATRVEDPDQIGPALQMALAQEGPALLDIWIEGSYPERES